MDIFLARQPIFNKKQQIIGYELLYRKGSENSYSNTDGDQASSNVIANSFMVIGMETLTSGKKAFINFTRNLLKQEIATIFPMEQIVIEILEDIEPDQEIIDACRNLKALGYTIALDDFVFDQKFMPLIQLADIIKIDFLLTNEIDRKSIITRFKRDGLIFLAEKIETLEEYTKAIQMGYDYFQGYFFSKPTILTAKDIPQYKHNYLDLIRNVNESEPDIDIISKIIERDVSLSYSLLKLINSAAFYLRSEIKTVKHAIVMLGIAEIKKWATLIALRKIGENAPSEVLRLSLMRARMAEMLAKKLGFEKRSDEAFLVGLFSMIDVLMNQSIQDVLKDLPISGDVKNALLDKNSTFTDIYSLVLAYEKGNWGTVSLYMQKLKLNIATVSNYYVTSLQWANELIRND